MITFVLYKNYHIKTLNNYALPHIFIFTLVLSEGLAILNTKILHDPYYILNYIPTN